jgi:hypothetical protein
MTREEVVNAIRELAAKLGRTPSRNELAKMTTVSRKIIRGHFGTYTRTLRECRLEIAGGGRKLALETLFRDWASLVRRLKKIPTTVEYEELSSYSISPLLGRFKTWGRVPGAFLQKAKEAGWTEEWSDVMEIAAAYEQEHEPGKMCAMVAVRPEPRVFMDRTFYGPPINRDPLAHGPTNESGVLFLFGAMAEELGFIVQHIQTGYPDCEAMREVEPGRWQRVRIELEYESRNFLKHGHDISKCDLIVCWENNWPDCPLEVVELKKAISDRQSATSQRTLAADLRR